MKKIFALSILCLLFVGVQAQTKVLSSKTLKAEQTFYSYDGRAGDSLTIFQDTIQQEIFVNKDYSYAISLRTDFDTIGGIDTLVYIRVWGKTFSNDSWSNMIADSSAVVSAAISKTVTNATANIYQLKADTTAVATDSLNYYIFNASRSNAVADNYRYLLIEYIIAGDDHVGKGVLLKKVQLNLIRKE